MAKNRLLNPMQRILASILMIVLFLSSCSELDDAFGRGRAVSPVKNSSKISVAVPSTSGEMLIKRAPIKTRYGTYYFIQQGDNLVVLAQSHGLTFAELARINHFQETQLSAGRRVFFPNAKYKEQFLSESPPLALNTSESQQNPVPSKSSFESVSQAVTAKVASNDQKRSKDKSKVSFVWPVEGGGTVTSRFGPRRGRRHDGIDVAAPIGTNILAAADGKIIFAERFAGYGNLIVIKHASNYFTAYAHASTLYASEGQKVKQGQRISAVGSTGRSTGPHLHFELRRRTEALDPLSMLQQNSQVKFVNLSQSSSSVSKKGKGKKVEKNKAKTPIKKGKNKKTPTKKK